MLGKARACPRPLCTQRQCGWPAVLCPYIWGLCVTAAAGTAALYVATGHTEKLACASAACSLWNGTAGRYSELMQAREQVLAGPEDVAVLPRITQETLVPALFFDDIVSDASD